VRNAIEVQRLGGARPPRPSMVDPCLMFIRHPCDSGLPLVTFSAIATTHYLLAEAIRNSGLANFLSGVSALDRLHRILECLMTLALNHVAIASGQRETNSELRKENEKAIDTTIDETSDLLRFVKELCPTVELPATRWVLYLISASTGQAIRHFAVLVRANLESAFQRALAGKEPFALGNTARSSNRRMVNRQMEP
jgi:hypothetical protein